MFNPRILLIEMGREIVRPEYILIWIMEIVFDLSTFLIGLGKKSWIDWAVKLKA